MGEEMDETKNDKRIGKIEKKLNDLVDRGSTEESMIKKMEDLTEKKDREDRKNNNNKRDSMQGIRAETERRLGEFH